MKKFIVLFSLCSCAVFAEESVQDSDVANAPASNTGFYGGVSVGFDRSKAKFVHDAALKAASSDTSKALASTSKSKVGFSGDIFSGYNFNVGNILLGAECSVGINSGTTTKAAGYSSSETGRFKRKYSFGFSPRVGYSFDAWNCYVSAGTLLSKASIQRTTSSASTKKSPLRASFTLGLGVERSFGSLFVRCEGKRVFNRKFGEVDGLKVSASSYVFNVGGGYKF